MQEYLAGGERKYLQDELITMRGERYVLPVKVEYKRAVRGLIHDRSQSGQTVFIEPEEVLEMNNELRTLHLDEEQEIARILAELSHRVGAHREALERDTDILSEVDSFYARAEYGHRLKCVRPVLNGRAPCISSRGGILCSIKSAPCPSPSRWGRTTASSSSAARTRAARR